MLHQAVHKPQLQALCCRFNRLFVGACSRLCQVDLYETESFRRRPPRRRPQKRTAWPALALDLVCLYCSAKILANCYLQYHLDIKTIQYRLEPANNSSESLKLELEQWRRLLKLMGAPYINYAFLAECFYEYALWITLVAYYHTRLYFRLAAPLNIGSVRWLVDEARERHNYELLVQDECRRYLDSARRFRASRQRQPCAARDLSARLLRRLAGSGRLRPFNRSSGWLDWLQLISCCLSASFVIFTTLMTSAVMLVLPSLGWFGLMDFAGPMDYATLLEGFSLGLVNIASVGFYLTINVIMTADQIQSVLRLNRAIRLAIERTHAGHMRLLLGEGQQHLELALKLNGELLRVLMHYKLLVSQTRPLREPSGFLASVCVQILLFGPLLWRLHIRLIDTKLTGLLALLCLFVVFWCDLSVVPICYLYGRYERLYRSLFSLMARALAVDGDPGEQSQRRPPPLVYDRHLLVALLRELAHPHQLVEQFAVKLAGALKLNYATLLRAHFWLGILIISSWLSLRSSASKKSLQLNTIFDNPFVLY